MKDILTSLCNEAAARGWNFKEMCFVMHPSVFWTRVSSSVRYSSGDKADDTEQGFRGCFEFEGISIRVRVNQHYKENRIVLYKDTNTSTKSIFAEI